MTDQPAISFAAVEAAAARLAGQAVLTPLLTNAALDARLGCQAFIKPECLQRTGSFKFRGAYNRLAQLTAAERAAGVIAWSSGNHAQGVAAAARLLGIPATIVMPADAPAIKMANTRALGAEIITYDRYSEDREEIGRRLSRERGAALVPSYDDPHIIAGQGTAGLEMARQLADAGGPVDHLLVCCGGGGLVAGMATAFATLSPATRLWAVEPRDFNDHERSFVSGTRQTNDPAARSFCDALLSPTPGEVTWPINSRLLAGAVSVTDEEVAEAMRFAFSALKLVVEPGGAVALAAALSGRFPVNGGRLGILISGGNVDPGVFASVIGA